LILVCSQVVKLTKRHTAKCKQVKQCQRLGPAPSTEQPTTELLGGKNTGCTRKILVSRFPPSTVSMCFSPQSFTENSWRPFAPEPAHPPPPFLLPFGGSSPVFSFFVFQVKRRKRRTKKVKRWRDEREITFQVSTLVVFGWRVPQGVLEAGSIFFCLFPFRCRCGSFNSCNCQRRKQRPPWQLLPIKRVHR
jgi:hypothetical protein